MKTFSLVVDDMRRGSMGFDRSMYQTNLRANSIADLDFLLATADSKKVPTATLWERFC